jgi:Cdc6-like AAA superfamily ATPase
MSHEAVQAAAAARAFAPTGKTWLMSARHIPFEDVVISGQFETKVAGRLNRGEAAVLIGASGSGKTSLATWVSGQLADHLVSVRLLVSALADPADVGEVMKLAIGTLLDIIELDASTREQVHIERADSRTSTRAPTGVVGGRLGGGPIPAQVNIEVGSLRQEFRAEKLNGEYISALNRILAILADKGVQIIFVMDDAEAIVGSTDQAEKVEGLVGGAVRIFVEEIDAAFLLAIQPHLVEACVAYGRISASMLSVTLPRLDERAPEALTSILSRCLDVAEIAFGLDEVLSPDALTGLVQFYDDTGGDLRKTLSAATYAVDDAADMNAIRVTDAHVRVGASQAR